MGGCRCNFRDCFVNTTRNPRMHFFKFPVADKKRFEKWIKFSGAHDIINLKRSQQHNRVICGRHFRDESFMNYKKDRLCPGQVPTITRISETLALDYENLEEDDCTPQLIQLTKPTQTHLIPPPGFECPLDLSEGDDDINIRLQMSKPGVKTYKKRPKMVETTSNIKRLKKNLTTELPISESSEMATIDLTDENLIKVGCKPKLIESRTFNQSDRKSSSDCVCSHNEDSDNELAFAKRESELPLLNQRLTRQTIINGTKRLDRSVHKKESEMVDSPGTRDSKISESFNTSKEDIDSMEEYKKNAESKYGQLADEHRKLQAAHAELTAKIRDLENQLKAKSSHPQLVPKATQQPLTKAQLFNGIKRYLCSSMTTLVRMEMFGSPEREWKPDEKQVTVDLLRLGESVYNYFTDEWRFRMPSLSVARNWLDNSTSPIDDDEENL